MTHFHTIYINLDRSVERDRLMKAQFAELKWEAQRWRGIDGQTLESPALSLYSAVDALLTQGRPMSLGELGCFLSHREVWEFALSQRYQHCLVMEDDVIFNDRLRETCTTLVNSRRTFDYVTFKTTGEKIRQADETGLVRFRTPPSSASCYLLSLRGAERLVSQSLPIRAALDGFMAEYSAGIDRYGVLEDLVEYRSMPSDIRDMGLRGKVLRRTAALKYWAAAALCRHGHVNLARSANLIDPPERVPF